eukprot:Nitzschia sp. Nitz4//scaffold56_size114212//68885//69841//NITZ4_003955-RA/size114212-processed-gene-0.68-mRNA-1//-1//CDS//3329554721//3168//frame0
MSSGESEDNLSEWSEPTNPKSSSANSSDEYNDGSDDDSLIHQLNRTILWLCQEGQIPAARQRFEQLLEQGQSDPANHQQLLKEVFQMGRDRNYPLQEILMGGTSDRNSYALVLAILEFAQSTPLQRNTLLLATPPSHGRTALHWATWGNAKLEIIQALVRGNPEAMLLRDKPRHGGRTPREILVHYFGSSRRRENETSTGLDSRVVYLEAMEKSWMEHRIRLAVWLCARRYFAPLTQEAKDSTPTIQTPFDQKCRKSVGIRPKPWFALSAIGYMLQREMTPLAIRITSYLGGNAAKLKRSRKASGRSRSSNKSHRTRC